MICNHVICQILATMWLDLNINPWSDTGQWFGETSAERTGSVGWCRWCVYVGGVLMAS